MTFAGDIDPQEAWEMLKGNPAAQLVDVRTAAEWAFVGVPDLSPLGRTLVRAEWQMFPSMQRNPEFETMAAQRIKASGGNESAPVLFICRSGARSRSAAQAMAAAGFNACFNVASGFEGDLDATKHRGASNGWKFDGLPWVQA